MLFTPAQLSAARHLVGLSRVAFGKVAGVSEETIKNLELGRFKPQTGTIQAILRAMTLLGVRFTEDEGVAKTLNKLITFRDKDGFTFFLDQLYAAAQNPEARDRKFICEYNVSHELFQRNIGDYLKFHSERMLKLKDVKIRILSPVCSKNKAPSLPYHDVRYLTDDTPSDVAFCVYEDTLVLIDVSGKETEFVMIASPAAARAYRHQFNFMWTVFGENKKTR